MSEVIDLRGREFTVPPPPVLADPSGRRARLLSRGGRVLAFVALLWVAGLALAGLGILPASDIPLGHAVAGPQAPSGWTHPPKPSPPTAQDLRPATPANSTATGANRDGRGLKQVSQAAGGQPSGSSLAASGQQVAVPGSGNANHPTVPGVAVGTGLTNATGRGGVSSASAPGRTSTITRGNSGSSRGQARQATTPAGKSATTPGHTAWTPSNGHPKLS